jgi:hypothetical protein
LRLLGASGLRPGRGLRHRMTASISVAVRWTQCPQTVMWASPVEAKAMEPRSERKAWKVQWSTYPAISAKLTGRSFWRRAESGVGGLLRHLGVDDRRRGSPCLRLDVRIRFERTAFSCQVETVRSDFQVSVHLTTRPVNVDVSSRQLTQTDVSAQVVAG